MACTSGKVDTHFRFDMEKLIGWKRLSIQVKTETRYYLRERTEGGKKSGWTQGGGLDGVRVVSLGTDRCLSSDRKKDMKVDTTSTFTEWLAHGTLMAKMVAVSRFTVMPMY